MRALLRDVMATADLESVTSKEVGATRRVLLAGRGPGSQAGAGRGRQGQGHPSPCGGAQVREELERRTGHSLAQHKDFIDNEMLLVLAQMDRPSRVFPHLYLVGSGAGRAGRAGRTGRAVHTPHRCHRTGLGVERSQPGGAAAEPVSMEWHGDIWGVTVGWA